jgi:uncharacterized membrane protein YqjE
MTTATRTPKGSAATGLITTVALSAIVSGLAGVGLHKGFGVPVPFMAGFTLIMAFAFLLRLAVLIVSRGWQEAAIAAAPQVAAGVVVGSFFAETTLKEALGAEALKDFEKHLAEAFPAEDTKGGYL